MKKEIRLYNVLFPMWMLVTLPVVWYIVIPGNFLIDSLVLILAMKANGVEDRKGFYKKHILGAFLLGFLADLLASIPMWFLLDVPAFAGDYGDGLLMTVPAVILAGVLIYVFDYYFAFRRCEQKLRRSMALTFAIATAPYTFLIPSKLLYGIW